MPSYNNALWCKRNLGSIFSQDYDNYRIIYVDDCSRDGTADLVEAYVTEKGQGHRFTFIRNKRRRGALYNRYKAIHMCDDKEIVLLVDGDDWLADMHVFKKINEAYDDSNVWLTYSVHLRWPEVRKGWGKAVPKNLIQKNAFRTLPPPIFIDHLRTFYAWLFKLIKLEDLLVKGPIGSYQGKFYPTNTDAALLFPMIEMARKHFKFIRKYFYIYNRGNPLHTGAIKPKLIERIGKVIRASQRYRSIDKPIMRKYHWQSCHADLIIVSFDPENLENLLNSLDKKNITGVDTIYVLIPKATVKNRYAYKQLRRNFAHVRFINQADMGVLQEVVQKTSNEHVVITSDHVLIDDDIDFSACVKVLKQTFAHGFYLCVDKATFIPKLPREELYNDICVWMFEHEKPELIWPQDKFMVIFNKQTILAWLVERSNQTLDLSMILPKNISLKKIGLFYKNAKVVKQ